MSAQVQVERFFARTLPEALRRQRDALAASRGTLSLFVEGAGTWCVTFGGAPDAAITTEASFDSDAVAVFTVDAFAKLLGGDASARPVSFLGDERLLTRLGTLMLPPARGALGVRSATPISKPQRRRRNLDHVTHLS